MALLVCNFSFADLGSGAAAAAEVPIGVHSMLQLNSPYSFMQAMFAEAARMHVSAIRLDVAPSPVFPDPSQPPDFSGLDEVMALSQQYQLPVIANLSTIPPWIAACPTPTDTFDTATCGTNEFDEYQALIGEIVAHADPVIRDWEIWNEPDLSEFFRGTPQQYAQMLRAAHDAVKAVDPQAEVLLGGISSTSGMGRLTQVFAVPGADAAHAFDIANIHERGQLDALAGDVALWRQFLAGYGFSGPLWVTEHGYPSDPAFQYDPSYASGPLSQAAYLPASIPTLLDAGAGEVFVTERDNLGGQYASEGVLGGNVLDPPVTDPQVVEKPAYAAVRGIADCYASSGHDCPGPTPAATPPSVTFPPTRLRSSTVSLVSVSDPGPSPVQLGSVGLVGETPSPIGISQDGCSTHLLEPDEHCTIALRFQPVRGGNVVSTLQLPSSDGVLSVALTAVAPSVSSWSSPKLSGLEFTPIGAADGVGHKQRLVLTLTNPLSAPVHIAGARLSGSNAREFLLQSDRCSRLELAPGAECHVSVLFKAAKAGAAEAILTLRGDGRPLMIRLHANPVVRPAIALLASSGGSSCFAPASPNLALVTTDQPASVSWQAVRLGDRGHGRCVSTTGLAIPRTAGRLSASGRTSTGDHGILAQSIKEYVARFVLPAEGGRRGLQAGAYRLTVTATNAHGTRRAKTVSLTLLP